MFLYIHIPFVTMREKPTSESKICSQALFGEEIQVGKPHAGWVSITTPDHYTGWVPEGGFVALEKPYQTDLEVSRLSAHIYGEADTEFGPLLTIPHGSKLHLVEVYDSRWLKVLLPDGREGFIQKGDVEAESFELVSFAKKFLGLPYTWGGRSSFGYDCSGFVQMIYAKRGIRLLRDARQQITQGRPISIDELALGDLIFWGKSEKQIGHVGMFLGGGEFIHTSSRENKPFLRVSKLTDFEWSGDGKAYYPYRSARKY